ncbi:hypothetical protein ACJ73_10242, partial [Blastomyces percursus]
LHGDRGENLRINSAHINCATRRLISIQGGYQIGNSLAALRQLYDLGVRYITVTHNCDSAFGTAASTVAAGGIDKELTDFGRTR